MGRQLLTLADQGDEIGVRIEDQLLLGPREACATGYAQGVSEQSERLRPVERELSGILSRPLEQFPAVRLGGEELTTGTEVVPLLTRERG